MDYITKGELMARLVDSDLPDTAPVLLQIYNDHAEVWEQYELVDFLKLTTGGQLRLVLAGDKGTG
jgi:hypothetical protein